MTTPEDREKGASPDQQADRAAWGRQPAGGWGDAADATRAWDRPDGDDGATRVDAPRGAHPGGGVHPGGGAPRGGDVAPADATRLDHQDPGGGQGPRQWGTGPDLQAPAWAQQPGPGGGWNPQQAPYPPQQLPPQQAPSPWGPPQPGGHPQGAYPSGPPQGGQWGAPGGTAPGWGGPQPGTAPPWGGPGGPGYPPLPGAAAPRRRSRLPLLLGAVAVLALALFLVLGFVAPGFLRTTVFDQAALQAGVQRVLTDDYRYAGVGEVRCGTAGEVLQVRTGAQFTCSTTIDGAPATIPVRVTSDSGDYEVSRPL